MFNLIDKYRKEADYHFHHSYSREAKWRQVILECIFRPKMRNPPDWRKYRVEDHPALMEFQKRCHASDLHDPWLRNYACQLYPNMVNHRSRTAFITQGCLFGFVVGGLVFGLEKFYDHYYPTTYNQAKVYIEKHGTGEMHH